MNKKIFKKQIKSIEVEVSSFCNRKCEFCPNKFIDRISNPQYINDEVLVRLISDLKSINYDGWISFSRYNEPLANRKFLDYVKMFRDALPNAYLHTNTNGDYIGKTMSIEELKEAGLNSLRIQDYDNKIKNFNSETYGSLTVSYEKQSKKERFCNRGGLLDNIEGVERFCDCSIPYKNVYIDYNSNMVPCCNIRSDAEEHKKYILGNLKEDSIFDIYSSNKMKNFKNHLREFKNIKYMEKTFACRRCTFDLQK